MYPPKTRGKICVHATPTLHTKQTTLKTHLMIPYRDDLIRVMESALEAEGPMKSHEIREYIFDEDMAVTIVGGEEYKISRIACWGLLEDSDSFVQDPEGRWHLTADANTSN